MRRARIYNSHRRPKRRDNLEYYIQGSRVSKREMAIYLGNMYRMPPTTALNMKMRDVKQVLSMRGVDTYYNSREGIMIKR